MQQRNKARAREIQNIFECHPTSSIQGLNVTCVCSADQFLHIIPKKVVHTRNKIYTTMYIYHYLLLLHHTADGPKAKHSRAFVILLSFDPPRLGSYSKKIGQIFYDRTTYTQNQDLQTYPRPNPHSKPKNSSPLQKKKF